MTATNPPPAHWLACATCGVRGIFPHYFKPDGKYYCGPHYEARYQAYQDERRREKEAGK